MLLPILLTANLALLIRRTRKNLQARLSAAGVIGQFNANRDEEMFRILEEHEAIVAAQNWNPFDDQHQSSFSHRPVTYTLTGVKSGMSGNEAYLRDLFGDDVYDDLAQANDW